MQLCKILQKTILKKILQDTEMWFQFGKVMRGFNWIPAYNKVGFVCT